MWYDEERFKEKLKTCKKYEARDKELFHSKEHPPLWHYNMNTKLYYVGRNGAKERWVSFNEYITIRKRRERIDMDYKNRCAGLEKRLIILAIPILTILIYFSHIIRTIGRVGRIEKV